MKYSFIFSFIFFISSSTFAQKADVTIIDSNIDGSELNEHFNVHRGSTHRSSIPDKDQRDSLLVEFERKTSAWDELKKDIFYMDLKSKSLKDLKKKYPEFSRKDLSQLRGKN